MGEHDASARDRVLQVAGAMFAERGFDGVSVADIATSSGISTGLVYYHFKDKQTLYETVVRVGVHLLEEVAVRTLAGDGTPTDRIGAFVFEYMALLEGQPALMRLLIRSVTDLGGPAPQHVLMRSATTIDRVRSVVEEGVAAGDFRELDAHLAATALFALVNTLMTARVLDTPLGQHNGEDLAGQAAFMTDLFLGGIAKCS
ncbi:MAG: TetR/AcrR family transcriptional regulator [Coriobacteriia bacterium]|nr:TetR/AcrR family transcriptional regulator [Coriobacteriia bacterium]